MLIEQPPLLYRLLFPEAVWRIKRRGGKPVVYLTFDDGPIPEQTPWVLDVLDRYGIKATFFMVGDNVRRHPELLDEVRRRGHSYGNHTMHHLQGMKVRAVRYLRDVAEADQTYRQHPLPPPTRLAALETGCCPEGAFQHRDVRPCDTRLFEKADTRRGVRQCAPICPKRLNHRISRLY